MKPGNSVRRVLMTTDTVGGVWTFAVSLAQTLVSRGVEVVLATMGARPAEYQLAQVRPIPGLRLHSSEYRLEWMNDPWEDVGRSSQWLMDLDARYAPDVLHLNSFSTGVSSRRTPVVLTVHSCVLRGGRL